MSINDKVIEYQKTKSEAVFREIYETIHKGGRLIENLAHSYRLDYLDSESIINEVLLSVVKEYNGKTDFERLLNRSLRNRCIDRYRHNAYREENEQDVMSVDDNGMESELYEVSEVAPTTNEDSILDEIRKRLDQRQLIETFLVSADEHTKATVSAFLDANSYRDVAKRLGICHKTAKARIRRLERKFNEDKFGSYCDYFTVPTVHVG